MATTIAGAFWAEIIIPAGVVISVTNNGGGPTNVTITPGTYAHISALINQIETDLETQRPPSTNGWMLTEEVWEAGSAGKLTITTDGGAAFSIAWTSTILRDLLGFAANITSQTTATGTLQVRGVWMPDHPLYLESGNHRSAPRVTDLRQSQTPTGRIFGHVGNVSYRHRGLAYSHVANNRVWAANEVTAGESLETFMSDTQWSTGSVSSFFVPSSRVTIVAHDGNTIGDTTTADQWQLKGCASMEDVVKRIDQWDGHWRCEFGELVSDGSA